MLNPITNMLLTVSAKRRAPGDPLVEPPPPSGPRWMKWLAAFWIANFFAFTIISAYLGGTALNGYVKDGHYFMAMHAHGQAFEVSRAVFMCSKWHAIGLVASLAIFMPLSYAVKRGYIR